MDRMAYLFLLPNSEWLAHLPMAASDISESFLITQGDRHTPACIREMGYPFAEIVVLDQYSDDHALEEAVKKIPVTRLVAPDESDILRAARLRELLNLEGQSLRSALAFQDKLLMKELVH